jgi:ApbE superfamily uncharacterized protein (UPF0280 family)
MFYHKYINSQFKIFKINYKQTDLFIGTDQSDLSEKSPELETLVLKKIQELYGNLEKHIKQHPDFKTALFPVKQTSNKIYIEDMIKYATECNVGPMAAVAGMFSDQITALLKNHRKNCFCENGGDISIDSEKEISLIVFPGSPDFSTKIKMIIPPGKNGIASSGKIGHSLSLGQADIVSVGAENATRADAFATAIANRVVRGKDNSYLVEEYAFLDYVLIVEREKIWYKGSYEIEFVK